MAKGPWDLFVDPFSGLRQGVPNYFEKEDFHSIMVALAILVDRENKSYKQAKEFSSAFKWLYTFIRGASVTHLKINSGCWLGDSGTGICAGLRDLEPGNPVAAVQSRRAQGTYVPRPHSRHLEKAQRGLRIFPA